MQKSNINPEILQQVLESASNAGDKGQSQFFTPIAFGQLLASALPKCRPSIVDLTCGAGHLLQASANESTLSLLGSDIDPCRIAQKEEGSKLPDLPVAKIAHDITLLAPVLKEVRFQADCFVLNPPWRLYWHRERLAYLQEASLPAVRMAFQAAEDPHAGGCPREAIDSTVATLAIALDLCTIYGEGFLIANDSTLQRLLFAPDAPHAALAKHVWLHLTIPGNPMTGIDDCNFVHGEQFHTGVIYFAANHQVGPRHVELELSGLKPENLRDLRQWRQGAELRNAPSAINCAPTWQTVKDHLVELAGRTPKVPWNLWLGPNGRIKTALSRFEERSVKVKKAEAARLFALADQSPMELVLQRAQRDELLHVAEEAGWRVQPELLEAVKGAIQQYHAARAPLYALPEIQRLGYLDEQDSIACKADLRLGASVAFAAGRNYPLRTQTVPVERKVRKPNPQTGDEEVLELTGQELAILLKVEDNEYCFMDARLQTDPDTKVPNVKACKRRQPGPTTLKDPSAIDFSLQELCAHFIIPDVPDVATVNPKGYEKNLELLNELETVTA